MENLIERRDASRKDAVFIAGNVMAAMGFPEMSDKNRYEFFEIHTALTAICRREDTLYSWRRTRVAMVGDKRVGSMTAYNGGLYGELKSLTCKLLCEFGETLSEVARELIESDEETTDGEFYLDSLAVLPEFRKHGIGTMLLKDAVQIGKSTGFQKVTLIVDREKPRIKALYERIGFQRFGEMMFFGTCYDRMLLPVQNKK